MLTGNLKLIGGSEETLVLVSLVLFFGKNWGEGGGEPVKPPAPDSAVSGDINKYEACSLCVLLLFHLEQVKTFPAQHSLNWCSFSQFLVLKS